jgi:hypothetical protein
MSPLVDWMSRHGWKLLVALVVIELLFHAYAVSAQESAASVNGRPATVRVNVSVSVPRVAFVRQIVPLTVVDGTDGRREVSFNVVVTANCRWELHVRPRFPYRRGSMPPMDVQSAAGDWVRLDQAVDGVVVVPEHAACTAEGHPVRLRLQAGDPITVLGRVQFDVTPIPE